MLIWLSGKKDEHYDPINCGKTFELPVKYQFLNNNYTPWSQVVGITSTPKAEFEN